MAVVASSLPSSVVSPCKMFNDNIFDINLGEIAIIHCTNYRFEFNWWIENTLSYIHILHITILVCSSPLIFNKFNILVIKWKNIINFYIDYYYFYLSFAIHRYHYILNVCLILIYFYVYMSNKILKYIIIMISFQFHQINYIFNVIYVCGAFLRDCVCVCVRVGTEKTSFSTINPWL